MTVGVTWTTPIVSFARGREPPLLDELANVRRTKSLLGGVEPPAGRVVVVRRPVRRGDRRGGLLHRGRAFLLPRQGFGPDAVQPRGGANEETVPCDRRGRHAHVVGGQGVGVQQGKFLAVLQHERDAVLAQAEDLAVIGPGRRRKRPAVRQAFGGEELLAVARIETAHRPPVVQHVQPVVAGQRRRVVGAGPRERPGNELVRRLVVFQRDVALGPRPDRVDRPR